MSERWVDVAHEALIRGWPRLRGWIEEDRAGLRMHRRLTEAAQEWHKSRDESALYRGARLTQAVEWRERNGPSLNELERTFLDAGIALERHEAGVRQRRRRRVIFWLSASLVVFAVLAGLAVLQWKQAYRQGQIALARQLGAQAGLVGDRPQVLVLRLLLATEAMKRLHAVEAQAQEVEHVFRDALAPLPRHVARFNGEYVIGFSPDGRYLIGGAPDENTKVWEIATGKELVRFEVGAAREFTATLPGKVVSFQVAGKVTRNFTPAVSGDGKYVVTMADGDSEDATADGASGNFTQVWETETGRELLRIQRPGSRYYALSADGRYLAVSTQIWDRATNRWSEAYTRVWDVHAQREIPGSAPGSVRAFSQDATVVATSSGLWEVTAELKQVFGWELDDLSSVALSSDGGHVAIGTERAGQNQIEVWSRAAKKMTASVPTPDSGVLLAVTFDGRFVFLSTRHGSETSIRDEMQVYDMAAKVIVSRSTLDVRAAVVTPTGQHLIASPQKGENVMDVWELGQEGGAGLAIGHEGKVIAVGLAPPGVLATIAQNGEKLIIRAWDVRTRLEMPERRAEVTGTGAVFAPDDQSFAVMGDGGVEVRRVDQPEPVAKFAYAKPANIVWSPDGRYLAAQKDRDVVVWDLKTRQSIGQLALPEQPISLALTKGGDSLAAVFSAGVSRAGERHYGKLWKVANGEVLKSFEPSTGENYWEKLDLTDILDEMKTSSALSAVADKTGKAQDDHLVAHDQESRYLVTINDRNTVRVWLLRQDDLIEEACRRLPRNLSEGEWREYVGDAAYRKACPELP